MSPTSTDERADFGSRLRRQRESRSLTVTDVSKTTKIPERSVSLLEAGAFEDLPGDIFVRGFLKSYCRVVGLESEATLREYEELRGKGQKPRREPSLVRPGVARPTEPVHQAAPQHEPVKKVAAAAVPSVPDVAKPLEAAPGSSVPPVPPVKDELSLFGALKNARLGTSRASLTLAVIILVIVATLTLSLLLQGPGRVGDGVSFRVDLR